MEDTLVKNVATTNDSPKVVELRVADRCDACSAQAFMIAHRKINGVDMELLFCGHHGREAEPALIAQGFSIQDETHRINEKPTDPDADHF